MMNHTKMGHCPRNDRIKCREPIQATFSGKFTWIYFLELKTGPNVFSALIFHRFFTHILNYEHCVLGLKEMSVNG